MRLVLASVLALTVALPPPVRIPTEPHIGDIVLMRIDIDEDEWRPVIVTYVAPDQRIDGEIILRVNGDQYYDWPQQHLAETLNLRNRIIPALHIMQGDGLGDWKFKP